MEKAIKGFQVTGICPLNPHVFNEEDFAPADYLAPLHNLNESNQELVQVTLSKVLNETTDDIGMNASTDEIVPVPGTFKVNIISLRTVQNSEISTLTSLKDQHEAEETEMSVSVEETLALPGPSKEKKIRRTGHSEILISTPPKKRYEVKEKRKLKNLIRQK